MMGAVSAKTDYLIVGQRFGNTKISAALELGTFTITEEEFYEMIQKREHWKAIQALFSLVIKISNLPFISTNNGR